MVSFIEMKKQLKKDIMAAVNEGKPLDRKKLIARFSLETGFTERLIDKMLDQLDELGYLQLDEFVVKQRVKDEES